MNPYRIMGAVAAVALSPMGCQRTADLQCYAADPHSPVVWSEVEDPVGFLTDEYCGRGASAREGLERNLIWHCIPTPADGCHPCLLESDEVELEFRADIQDRFDAADCPSSYEPEEIVAGCVLELVETNTCCWAGEYFTDPEICDPDGTGQIP
jgi:hypothetical protein